MFHTNSFDLLFAVAAPIVVLAYCYNNFYFDRGLFQVYTEVLATGSFERQARMLANPAEIFLFRTSFESLRILSSTDFVLRIGMNLSFCNRLKRVVEVQIARAKRAMKRAAGSTAILPTSPRHRAVSTTATTQQSVPRVIALVFVLFGLAVVTWTHRSIQVSTAACAAYPECVQFVQQWDPGDACPCLVLVREDKELRTYDAWTHPVDDTETVRQLARAGSLRVLQLLNRRLKELPDELRLCRDMRHMYVWLGLACATEEWGRVGCMCSVWSGLDQHHESIKMQPRRRGWHEVLLYLCCVVKIAHVHRDRVVPGVGERLPASRVPVRQMSGC